MKNRPKKLSPFELPLKEFPFFSMRYKTNNIPSDSELKPQSSLNFSIDNPVLSSILLGNPVLMLPDQYYLCSLLLRTLVVHFP